MASFASEWDFELATSAPHHQQANGKAESAVKIAKHLMKKADESEADFWYMLLHWRNIPNNIGSSPAARLLSRSTRCGVPTAATNLLPKVEEDVPAKIEENRKRAKLHYDKKSRNLPELHVGSPVYVQLNPESNKHWTQGTVSNKFNDRSYLVSANGTEYRRSLVHLKPRKESATQPDREVPSHPDRPVMCEVIPVSSLLPGSNEKSATTVLDQTGNDNTIGQPPTSTEIATIAYVWGKNSNDADDNNNNSSITSADRDEARGGSAHYTVEE